MLDIPATLLSLTRGMEMLKAIRDIDKSFDAASHKASIAELMSSVTDAKIALVDAREEIINLKRQIEKLSEDVLFKANNTVRFGSFVYEKYDNGSMSDLPFCPKCLGSGKFFVLLRSRNPHDCSCPNCQTEIAVRSVIRGRQEDPTSGLGSSAATG